MAAKNQYVNMMNKVKDLQSKRMNSYISNQIYTSKIGTYTIDPNIPPDPDEFERFYKYKKITNMVPNKPHIPSFSREDVLHEAKNFLALLIDSVSETLISKSDYREEVLNFNFNNTLFCSGFMTLDVNAYRVHLYRAIGLGPYYIENIRYYLAFLEKEGYLFIERDDRNDDIFVSVRLTELGFAVGEGEEIEEEIEA